jgi:hypothetical protein
MDSPSFLSRVRAWVTSPTTTGKRKLIDRQLTAEDEEGLSLRRPSKRRHIPAEDMLEYATSRHFVISGRRSPFLIAWWLAVQWSRAIAAATHIRHLSSHYYIINCRTHHAYHSHCHLLDALDQAGTCA